MAGMSALTGEAIDGIEHLRQSIRDILTTRKGTRVMRRDYGSNVPNLLDSPVTADFGIDLFVAVAESLNEWEPRFRLRDTSFTALGEGRIELRLSGDYLPNGKSITLEGVVIE